MAKKEGTVKPEWVERIEVTLDSLQREVATLRTKVNGAKTFDSMSIMSEKLKMLQERIYKLEDIQLAKHTVIAGYNDMSERVADLESKYIDLRNEVKGTKFNGPNSLCCAEAPVIFHQEAALSYHCTLYKGHEGSHSVSIDKSDFGSTIASLPITWEDE